MNLEKMPERLEMLERSKKLSSNMKLFFQKHQATIGLVSILLLASVTRFVNAVSRGTLWFDELFTYHFSQASAQYLVLPLQFETNPPLSFLIPRLSVHGIGIDDLFFLRFASVIFALGTIIVTYHIAKKLYSKRAGLLASSILTLSGVHILISGELRIYSFLAFVTIISSGLFLEMVLGQNKHRTKWWIFFGFIHTLLIFSHLTAFMVIIAEFMMIIIARPTKDKLKRYIISIGIPIVIIIPWLLNSVIQKISGISSGSWYFEPSFSYPVMVVSPFIGLNANWVFTIFILSIILLSVISIIDNIRRGVQKFEDTFILIMALLPTITSSLLGVFIPKFLVFSFPFVFIITARYLSILIKKKKIYTILPITLLIIMTPTAYLTTYSVSSDWTAGVRYIEEQTAAGDIIISDVSNAFSISKYYKGDIEIIPILQGGEAFDVALIKNNWHNINISDEELHEWLDKTALSKNPKKILLVYNDESMRRIGALLTLDSYEKQDSYTLPGLFRVYIDKYEYKTSTEKSQ